MSDTKPSPKVLQFGTGFTSRPPKAYLQQISRTLNDHFGRRLLGPGRLFEFEDAQGQSSWGIAVPVLSTDPVSMQDEHIIEKALKDSLQVGVLGELR